MEYKLNYIIIMNYPVDPRYQNGKLYFLRSIQFELEHPNAIQNRYFGSTIMLLDKRFRIHKKDFERWKKGECGYVSSFELIKYDDCEIVLIKNFPCRNKFELERFEGNIILKFWEKCFNIHVPGRTKEEQKQHKKEYDELHKEDLTQYHKKYYELHKEDIHRRHKEYRELHKEDLTRRQKKYDKKHKSKSFLCECGRIITVGAKPRHLRTEIHKEIMENRLNPPKKNKK